MNYYNEHDRKAAEWLRVLIREGHIAPGDVDERSIIDVQPTDLAGYVQCHFFAGIGGWSLALRLAGWPDDKEAWTGSCPCQPFSQAGKGLGTADERHLWPEFKRLISQCLPPVVFGEQVASAAGRLWLDGVRTDLEALAYSIGAADLCAAGVGAPHIRQRLYWVANSNLKQADSSNARGFHAEPGSCRFIGGVVLANGTGRDAWQSPAETARHGGAIESTSRYGGLGNPNLQGPQGHGELDRNSETGGGR